MVDDATVETADRILQEALDRSNARDPRPFYRDRLRTLKESDPEGYSTAVAYYVDTLVPSVVSGESDPLDAWTEYGRTLAAAVARGRTISIDPSGKAHPYEGPVGDHLILHLPDDHGSRALLVGLPPTLTTAQRASYDVLVEGKKKGQT